MGIKSVQEVVRERIAEATNAARDKFREAVKPIYGVTDRGDPEHIGSCLLLGIPKCRFILTAAHVLDWKTKTSLYIGGEDFALLQFEALVSSAPDGDRDKDHVDFAFARLDEDVLAKLQGARFIEDGDISSGAVSPEGRMFTALGYPNSKNKVNPYKGTKIVPLVGAYTSVGRPISNLPLIASERLHILVDYNAKYARDEAGKKVSATDLHGFSGGAIIDVGKISPENLTADFDPKIAALFIEGHKAEKVILGTRVSAILEGLRLYLQRKSDFK